MRASAMPKRTDIVVLGGGLAGCAATLAAAQTGAKVVQLEKQDSIGGSTVLSAGLSAYAGTDEQSAANVEDTVELLREDIHAAGVGLCDPALVDLYCSRQLETYRWFRGLGVQYGHLHAAAGQSVPRSHPTDTRRMLKLLSDAAAVLGAEQLTGVSAQRLLREEDRITGVSVSVDGGSHVIACDAVIVATGGFAQNRDMLEQWAPQMRLALQAGGAGNVGEGLRMAWALGAGITDMPYIKGTYGVYPHPHEGEHGTGIHAIYKGGIAVNMKGHRFVDESLPYKVIGDANLLEEDGQSIQIFDSRVMAASDPSVAIFDFEGRAKSGLLQQADTVEELAQLCGLPVDETIATVAEYNRRIESGEPDEFGRVHLSGKVGENFPLVSPPFFAHLSGTVVLATYCGLTVDTSMRVLDVFGEPIGGLYAAGEVIGGFHGSGYMTGTSIGKSGIFGRIAGESAAAHVGVNHE